MIRIALALLVGLTAGAAPLAAQRPLDHDAYERWRSIDDERLSADGRWVAYALTVEWGDAELRVRAADGAGAHAVPRGRNPAFDAAGAFVVFRIKPEFALERAARRAKKKADELPQDSLGILRLATGEVVRVADLRSFAVSEQGPWMAYLLRRAPAARDSAPADSAAPGDSARARSKKDSDVGSPLVLRHLVTGAEHRYEDVTEYAFSRDGARLVMALSSRDGSADGVVVVNLSAAPDRGRIAAGRGIYKGVAFDSLGRQVAFLTTRDEADRDQPRYALYHWTAGQDQARRVAGFGSPGMPAGWSVSEHRTPSFSTSGRRLFFGTAPVPAAEPKDTLLEDEKINVDVWHWQDARLQPEQLLEVNQDRRRNYLALVQVANGRLVQVATPAVPDVRLVAGGDIGVAIGESEVPYQMERSWDFPTYRDLYALDLETGRHRLMAPRQQSRLQLSPDGRWAGWYDRATRAWFARATDGRSEAVNVSAGVPHALFDEDEDHPYPPDDYGSAGWTADGRLLLVYDRHDVWALDPAGRAAPRNVTDGLGRRENLRLRVIRLDPRTEAVAADAPLLLSAFHYRTKQDGFYRDRVTGDRPPQRLVMMERDFGTPRRADRADRVMFTRESVAEFPDLWVSGPDFADMRRVSDANPQQGEYRWATVELVEWRSTDGTPLQGLLYKPDDFDPAQPYPMMVYFYERNADNLYQHYQPFAHRSVIRPTFYASRGYVVFIPDIVYHDGYPGESALDAVVPGVLAVLNGGYVDPARIGVQGHSWGGYQIAYLVTRTNLFRAAAGGAPVANMTSAYGGIRWGSGLSRMFQYERTQSRIGGSLWEYPLRYLENSPVFWADRIETPLLMMHNDQDGAVPWEQGIEMFVALRRLGKPAWLVNYNGEPHWPLPFQKRKDWNIRMQQFFDHYLMDAPPPEWLVRGIPAMEKGRNLGLELVTDGK